MNKHLVDLSLGVSLAAVACTGQLREQDHPCPCSSQWTCCPSANVCVPAGNACPAVDSGLTLDAGIDAASVDVAMSIDAVQPMDAFLTMPNDAQPHDICSGALTIAPGQTIKGTTCGGASGVSAPCTDGLVVFILVDAPDGATVDLTLSPGARFLMYPTCQSELPEACSGVINAMVETAPAFQVYGVNRYDTSCGDFTLSASASAE
jgi:hypothetical protein